MKGENEMTTALIVLSEARNRMGFITSGDVATLAADSRTRLQPCLVRCGSCRFIASAQDVAHLVAIIERDGADYVRDVALYSNDGGVR